MLASKEKEMLEEEIRVLYVALTGTKHMLVLSCDDSYEFLKTNRGNPAFPLGLFS